METIIITGILNKIIFEYHVYMNAKWRILVRVGRLRRGAPEVREKSGKSSAAGSRHCSAPSAAAIVM